MSHSEHSESVTSCITFVWPNCTYEFFFTAFRFVHVLWLELKRIYSSLNYGTLIHSY